jgi:hypothetical protein
MWIFVGNSQRMRCCLAEKCHDGWLNIHPIINAVPDSAQEAIDSVRQLAATLIRQSDQVPVQRKHFGSSMGSRMISTEVDAEVSDDWNWITPSRHRERRALDEIVFDPRLKLAYIFEDSVLFDFICDHSALIHLLQIATAASLPAIETEVDLHVLRKYDEAEFIGKDVQLAIRSIAGPYKKYRAQMVMAFAQAIHRYSKHVLSKRPHNLALGHNIDRLRQDCGWTYDVLSEKTGIDRRLILGHVQEGKGARATTLKSYADAFSRELKRPISVADLRRFPSD